MAGTADSTGQGAWVAMPWFPDFAGAVELARKQTRAAGQADPVGQYFTALNEYSSLGPPAPVMSSAATRTGWPPVTPKRW